MSEALRTDMTMRHPKRGQSHRAIQCRDLWTGKSYIGTACGLPRGSAAQMTEVVPVASTDPGDRCKRCFRQTAAPTGPDPRTDAAVER